MAQIRKFLTAIDAVWRPIGPEPFPLHVIGSAALMLDLYKRVRLYIDIVNSAILFLHQKPEFHPLPGQHLENFSVEVLDVVDVGGVA